MLNLQVLALGVGRVFKKVSTSTTHYMLYVVEKLCIDICREIQTKAK